MAQLVGAPFPVVLGAQGPIKLAASLMAALLLSAGIDASSAPVYHFQDFFCPTPQLLWLLRL